MSHEKYIFNVNTELYCQINFNIKSSANSIHTFFWDLTVQLSYPKSNCSSRLRWMWKFDVFTCFEITHSLIWFFRETMMDLKIRLFFNCIYAHSLICFLGETMMDVENNLFLNSICFETLIVNLILGWHYDGCVD